MVEIKQLRGDTKQSPFKITKKDTQGNITPFDLNGYTVTLTIKKHMDDVDTDAILKQDLTIVDAVNGEALISIDKATSDTFPLGTHYFDIQMTDGTLVRTTMAGRWIILDRVID